MVMPLRLTSIAALELAKERGDADDWHWIKEHISNGPSRMKGVILGNFKLFPFASEVI